MSSAAEAVCPFVIRTRVPEAPLNRFVECFWYYEGPPGPNTKERVVPNGQLQLLINLHEDRLQTFDRSDFRPEDRLHGGALCGPYSEYLVIDTIQKTRLVAVLFRPGGAAPFFRLPLDELHGLHVELGDLWGSLGRDLRAAMADAPTPEAMFDRLDRELRRALSVDYCPSRAVAAALRRLDRVREPVTIAALADEIGLSQRRLIRVFAERVGLSPKSYARLKRLRAVMEAVEGRDEADWAELAATFGYCDQAHLIHEFRKLAGLTPTAYLRSRGDEIGFLPIRE